MVLLVTNRDDLTADWLVLELQRRKARFLRFNTDEYPEGWRLAWDLRGGVRLWNQSSICLSDVEAIWFRRPVAPQPRRGLPMEDGVWGAREAAEALESVWSTFTGRWVSQPSAIRKAENKALQLRAALALGFDVPETVITNDADTLRELFERSPEGVVCKALTHGRVRSGAAGGLLFTSQVGAAQASALGPEPHLFQALVPKAYDVRVTVIGREAFSARIDSQTQLAGRLDWRCSNEELPHAVEVLPGDIEDRCVRLVAEFGLCFGAIDLARRKDGGYTFFELNPNGQWAWIEQRTGMPLRSRLAALLLEG